MKTEFYTWKKEFFLLFTSFKIEKNRLSNIKVIFLIEKFNNILINGYKSIKEDKISRQKCQLLSIN